jgi:hypothetical protein
MATWHMHRAYSSAYTKLSGGDWREPVWQAWAPSPGPRRFLIEPCCDELVVNPAANLWLYKKKEPRPL